VTDFCLKIPTKWKVYGEARIGKWILRKAFSDRLPEYIAWQTKRPFASGAGSSKIMRSIALKQVSDEEFATHQQTEEGLRLNSAEELYYYRIFKDSFPQPAVAYLVARWDPMKGDFRS
jgi:asparagine synthase (glutamine-hydrolysing)